ncbi:4'-phosphopantetheinyl transferase family protein (plasmid) [Agrobacterium sp. rho-8.1]|nr:4'-phosphopantetheinyl transferase superfamily protein [Agrobacterium sp. rho-8.1]
MLGYGDGALLASFSSRIQTYGVNAAWKAIVAEDRFWLAPDELAMFQDANNKVKAASGAARHLIRKILRERGEPEVSVIKTTLGNPIWPDNLVGSISHSDEVAFAVIANRDKFIGIGVDVEKTSGITSDLASLILTPSEQSSYGDEAIASIFSIKEACYKACYHADSVFFSFLDIEINLESSSARTKYGRQIDFIWSKGEQSAAFAFIAE